MIACESEFNSLIGKYYNAWFNYHPDLATKAGIKGYESKLPPLSNEHYGALIALNEKAMCCIGEFSYCRLDEKEKNECTLVVGSILSERGDLLKKDWRVIDPLRYIITDDLLILHLKSTNNNPHILSQLSQYPKYLQTATKLLSIHPERIPMEWTTSAMSSVQQGIRLLNAFKKMDSFSTLDNSTLILSNAVKALTDYQDFLEKDIIANANGNFANGEESYQQILQYKHLIDVDLEKITQFAEKLFRQTKAELQALTIKIQGNSDYLTLFNQLNQPNSDDVLASYQTSLSQLHAFIENNSDLFSENSMMNVTVHPLPTELEAIYPDSLILKNGQSYCAMIEKKYSEINIMHQCVSQIMPGALPQASNSIPRQLNASLLTTNGWESFCETMMIEHHYLDQPENQFIFLFNKLKNTFAMLIDIDIHSQNLTIQQAETKISAEFPNIKAINIIQQSRQPCQQTCAVLGEYILSNYLRLLKIENNDASFKTLQNKIISNEALALPLLIQNDGKKYWEKIIKNIG